MSTFASEATLRSDLSSTEWATALRKLVTDSALHLRALRLDDNVVPIKELMDTVGRLRQLTNLSMCDARLGSGVADLLTALHSVPAFVKSHAEVWAPIPALPAPPQGARLTLMRNGISDADLVQATQGRDVGLRGLHELALSGNTLIADAGLAPIAALAPSLRKLHLGRTGIVGGGTVGILDKHWPMLECLGLNGTRMTTDGFESLCKALHARARAVEAKKLLPSAANGEGAGNDERTGNAHPGGAEATVEGAVDWKAHRYFHLDLRELSTLSPEKLTTLVEKVKEYSKGQAKQPWIMTQSFGGGKYRHEGIVVRHDFEGFVTVRLSIKLAPSGEDGEAGPAGGSPSVYLELPDMPQKLSVEHVVSAIIQTANVKPKPPAAAGAKRSAHQLSETLEEKRAAELKASLGSYHIEKRVREAFERQRFPFCVGTGSQPMWRDTGLKAPGGTDLPCGNHGREALGRIAIGSLLHDQANPEEPRCLDDFFETPSLSEARRLIELHLVLSRIASTTLAASGAKRKAPTA